MRKILSITAFLTFITAMCNSCSSPSGPPIIGVDTTSHNFAWTKYTFGGPYGSSVISDAAIVNDSDIWFVGAVYFHDTVCNAMHWDGKNISPSPILFTGPLSNGIRYPILRSVLCIDQYTMLVTSGRLVAWIINNNIRIEDPFEFGTPGAINKLYGTSLSNIYGVGYAGSIVHYDGARWSPMVSGTTVDLKDIWCTKDGTSAWAAGYSSDGNHSVLLKYENAKWHTLWKRDGTTAVAPLGYEVGSVWGTASAFVTSTNGIFRLDGDSSYSNITSGFPDFIYRIRGNSDNDFVAVGDRQTIWHYNGADAKRLMYGLPTQPFYSGTMKGNTVVAVGTDFSIEFGAGLIVIGKR